MKPVKYTMVALALIAAASFTTSAKAQTAGDVILGVYDTDGTVPTSYEVDLGAFNTLTANESFNLGTTIASTFSSDSSATLAFNIIASGGTTGAAGGLANKEIAFTATSIGSLNGPNSQTATDINALVNTFAANATAVAVPSNGITAGTVANSTTGSYEFEIVNANNFGLGGNVTLTDSYPTSNVETFYTKLNNSSTAVADGTFSFSTNGSGQEILTFDASTTAVPEPSTYALVLCALALFAVLKRRNSVA